MDRATVRHGARRALTYYVVADFVIGPILVGAFLAGFAAWAFGVAATRTLGIPWPVTMAGVGLLWAGLGVATRRAVRWALRLARRPSLSLGPSP